MSQADEKSGIMIMNKQVAVIGSMEAFDVSHPELWKNYCERFEFYCISNDIADDQKKKAILTTVGGPSLYATMVSLCAPETVMNTVYTDLTKLLDQHFVPKRTLWAARFEFHKRTQHPDEEAAPFMAELQRLANDCKFKDLLDSMLITQFICGLRNEQVQRRLLQEKEEKLTKATALEMAAAAECAVKQQVAIREEPVKWVNKSPHRPNEQDKCNRCGARHGGVCKYVNAVCYRCNKKGHLESVCMTTQKKDSRQGQHKKQHHRGHQGRAVNCVRTDSEFNQQLATVKISGQFVKMEVDSGSPYTILSLRKFRELLPRAKLDHHTANITDFQGGRILVRGEHRITIEYHGQVIQNLPLLVVDCEAPSIIGRNWFKPLNITLQGVHVVRGKITIKDVLQEYDEVFSSELGCYKGPPVRFELNDDQPRSLPPRIVPMALREPVEKELAKLEAQGILVRLDYSDWATPIVPVKKSDGTIRICGDYKSTVNLKIKSHAHKVPSVNDLLSRIDGGKVFAKLDMSQAYQQLTVDEDTAKMQAIATHKGTFAVTRLQFGIAAAPGIFQSLMERLLCGLDGVMPYFDDFILVAKDTDELAKKLKEVLSIFATNGLRLRKDKCVFQASSVTFLGHRVDADGIWPLEEKIMAIKKSPAPTNKKELQAFLGMLGFYQPFLRDKATIAEPLHRLLDKDRKWLWTKEHDDAAVKLKELLSSDRLLTHYSLRRPVGLVADASPYGCGGVLFHIMEDGSERPVAFYSRTLSSAERNYSQLDRESVAIVSAVKKFHNYLYGRQFVIYNDHRPLLGILGQGPCPQVISPTMLRRRIFLSAYDAELKYRPAEKMGNADFLSRAPVAGESINFVDHKIESPFNSRDLEEQTLKDKVLSVILQWTRDGWPATDKKIAAEYVTYYRKRAEISLAGNCLLWGTRLIIPATAKKQMLHALHVSHPGVVKMKTLARQHIYWPSIDKEIEQLVGRCSACQATRAEPARKSHPWEPAEKPWSRIHIDHAGPFRGKLFLIVADAHTKWIDASIVSSTASAPTIARLRDLFATHGLPDTIVSDNGRGFISSEFQNFCKGNAITSYRVAPYMPASNGLAERNVQSVKNFLKKLTAQDDLAVELASYLLISRTTALPNGLSPSEMLMGRRVETYFDKLMPKKQRSFKPGQFSELDPVWIREYQGNHKTWVKGQVLKQLGHRVFQVELDDGRISRRHERQLRKRVDEYLFPELGDKDNESEYEDAVEELQSTDEAPSRNPPRRTERIRKQTSFYKGG